MAIDKKGRAIVKVGFDMKQALKGLNAIEKTQFPFAYALALTKSASAAREVIRKRTEKLFHLHGSFILNNILIEPAKKSDIISFGIAQAVVKTTARITFMTLHETGEDKKPKHKALAVPTPAFFSEPGVRSGSGKIIKKLLPAYLLGGKKKGKKQLPVFSHKGLVLMRVTKARYPLKTLYGFESKAHIKPFWEFEHTVAYIVLNKMESIFANALDLAVRTAK